MTTNQTTPSQQDRIAWMAVALATLAAVIYVLIALGVVPVGDLQLAAEGGVIIYVAAGCYLLGGLLIVAGWLGAYRRLKE